VDLKKHKDIKTQKEKEVTSTKRLTKGALMKGKFVMSSMKPLADLTPTTMTY
jgi:hypothetical protein